MLIPGLGPMLTLPANPDWPASVAPPTLKFPCITWAHPDPRIPLASDALIHFEDRLLTFPWTLQRARNLSRFRCANIGGHLEARKPLLIHCPFPQLSPDSSPHRVHLNDSLFYILTLCTSNTRFCKSIGTRSGRFLSSQVAFSNTAAGSPVNPSYPIFL
jgi:hypothetical protein